jgi:hypothetical protein
MVNNKLNSQSCLFQTLNQNLKASDISKSDKKKIIDFSEQLKSNSSYLVFLQLIVQYSKNNNKDPSLYLEEVGNDIEIDLDKFPADLNQILLKFINILKNSN